MGADEDDGGGGGPAICELGGRGVFLPALRAHGEQEWPRGLRAVLYMAGLLWCFAGIALISDVFMGAIERITAKRYRRRVKNTTRHKTLMVWNPTVANLTLMALGSSAPEILLNVIETLGAGFFSGDLGPSTIVGSAAFNHLCISAVCVCAIPFGEVRMVKETPVYAVTAAFSIFAYLWLLIILVLNSENVVESWEGIVTFMMFPLLVGLAYAADQGWLVHAVPNLGASKLQGPPGTPSTPLRPEDLARVEKEIRKLHGAWLSDEQVAAIMTHKHGPKASTTSEASKFSTLKMLFGRRGSHEDKKEGPMTNVVVPFCSRASDESSRAELSHVPVLQFVTDRYCVLENAGSVAVLVCRRGFFDDVDVPGVVATDSQAVRVGYRTRDGTAKGGADFKPMEGTLEFLPGVDQMSITITIVDNEEHDHNREFYVELFEDDAATAILGSPRQTTVLIVDDDLPGCLGFGRDELEATEEEDADITIDVVVHRNGGTFGRIGCNYHTENSSAVAGADYEATSGVLEMTGGQSTANIKLTIKATGLGGRPDMFRLVLSEPFGGARFDSKSDGSPEFAILTVWIKKDDESEPSAGGVGHIISDVSRTWAKTKTFRQVWKEQFVHAILGPAAAEEGEGEGEEGGSSSTLQWIVHVVICPWKVLFAIVPPVEYCNGWACFCCSLSLIGLVTAVVGDLANLLGCVMGVPGEITAITFVALGTSLPDTFASKTAAIQDPNADASIGNVTGSNSVNVFLGLGLPWLMASIYWENRDPSAEWLRRYDDAKWTRIRRPGRAVFVVEAGNLAFSVSVFAACAVICIIILYIRRRLFRGELGGPTVPKWITAGMLFVLWVVYIVLSAWFVLKET